jgi:hypothetical protein
MVEAEEKRLAEQKKQRDAVAKSDETKAAAH